MVTLKDKLFAIGGLRDVCVNDPVTPFVERFSGQSNSWHSVDYQPAMHDLELDSFCAVSVGCSSVLLVGGLDPKTNRCTSNVFSVELKESSSSVMPLASLSVPRAGHCLISSRDHVYAIGGFQTSYPAHVMEDVIPSVERYDVTKGNSKHESFSSVNKQKKCPSDSKMFVDIVPLACISVSSLLLS